MKDSTDSYKYQTDSSDNTQTENLNEGKTVGRPAPKRK